MGRFTYRFRVHMHLIKATTHRLPTHRGSWMHDIAASRQDILWRYASPMSHRSCHLGQFILGWPQVDHPARLNKPQSLNDYRSFEGHLGLASFLFHPTPLFRRPPFYALHACQTKQELESEQPPLPVYISHNLPILSLSSEHRM